MPEVETEAYERIRNFWRGEAVQMEVGNSAMTTSTAREVGDGEPPDAPEYTTGDAANPQIVQMTLIGSDTDVAQSVTYERVRLRRAAASGGAILFDGTFSPVAINVDEDQLTVIVNIEIPEIP